MTSPVTVSFEPVDLEPLAEFEGNVVVVMGEEGQMDKAGRRVNRLTRGALERFGASEAFAKMSGGDVHALSFPSGMAAKCVQVLRMDKKPDAKAARKGGGAIGRTLGSAGALVCLGNSRNTDEIVTGMTLRAYKFADHLSSPGDQPGEIRVMVNDPDAAKSATADVRAVAEGVFFTRDLVSEPANVLTTEEFANRLNDLSDLGLKVEVLEEADLEKLGMRTLLAVGQGSRSPSKVVVMSWEGGKKSEAPLALVGKGVVFDTGGISLKPAGGMEDMTMDMGGAGVVAGVMKTLALRKAKANVVGLVGLVENMPDGNATRPGDVVVSMKGDTVEIINTDAEGRLVLADVLWYAADRFKPSGMIDLATLTGAIIIGLGHENAGVFSNDDELCNAFLKAASETGEGAWRMPFGDAYDKQLKSQIADMKNVGGRPAGSITAAQFLQRFVKEGTPWIHLDIAGVASVKSDTTLAPKGATGWGVRALDQLVRNKFEG